MEIRKLIQFGNNSYVVSLPKKWIEGHKLKKGSLLYIKTTQDKLILGMEQAHSEQKPKRVDINAIKEDFATVKRMVIAHYINNYSLFYIKVKSRKVAKQVRDLIQNLMGLEVIEEDEGQIYARSFAKLDDISIPSLIRKNDNIIRSMFKELRQGIEDKRINAPDFYESIHARDQDINRLTFLIMRSIKFYLNNPGEKNELSEYGVLDSFEITQLLEKIGDELKRTTKVLVKMDIKKYKGLLNLIKELEKWYLDSMKAFYNKSPEQSYEITKRKDEIVELLDSFQELYQADKLGIKVHEKLSGVTRHIKRILRVTYQ